MDNRLNLSHGARRVPSSQLDTDLTQLAWAITAQIRGQAKVVLYDSKRSSFVRVLGSRGADVAIRKEDWAKIQPLLKDGTFNSQLFPVETGFKDFDPTVRFDTSLTESQDPLFNRVLFYLTNLFPEKVPED